MQLTREADYAIRIVLELASRQNGVPTSTLEIARRRQVPRPILRKLVQRLVAARLVRSRRGAHGGLLLARPPSEITLLAVIEAAQGTIAINRCVLQPDSCPLRPTCPVHEVCRLARAQLVRLFGGVTVADLVLRSAALRSKAVANL